MRHIELFLVRYALPLLSPVRCAVCCLFVLLLCLCGLKSSWRLRKALNASRRGR